LSISWRFGLEQRTQVAPMMPALHTHVVGHIVTQLAQSFLQPGLQLARLLLVEIVRHRSPSAHSNGQLRGGVLGRYDDLAMR
jgi:hypothetical protein